VWARNTHATAAILCILAALSLLSNEWRWRQHLPTKPFDTNVAAFLRKRGEPDAMLLARPDEFIPQARTGHPVLVEVATPSLISYMPELGPAIQQTYTDLYGIRFDTRHDPSRPSWQTLWQQRSAADWTRLAHTYGFHYVIAPADIPLNLPPLLEDPADTLYGIPKTQ